MLIQKQYPVIIAYRVWVSFSTVPRPRCAYGSIVILYIMTIAYVMCLLYCNITMAQTIFKAVVRPRMYTPDVRYVMSCSYVIVCVS